MGNTGQLMAAALHHHRAGDAAEAARLYEEVLRREPAHPDANQNLGVLLVASGQAARALQHFRRAVEGSPGDQSRWLAFCQCLLDTGRPAEALQALEAAGQAGHQGPRLADLRYAATLALKEADARQAILGNPESGTGWKLLGLVLQVRQQYPEAVLMLRKAASMLPADEEVPIALAYACDATNQPQAALESFDRALDLTPSAVIAHRGRATVLAKLGRMQEAEQSFLAALAAQPGNPDALTDYGRLLNALRRPMEAEARAREAILRDPANHAAYNVLGNALSRQGRHDAAEAAGLQALALKGDDAGYLNDLGGNLVTAGRIADAERHLRRALELAPHLHFAWINLALALMNSGRHGEATQCLESAIRCKPDFVDAYGTLGISLQFLGRLHEAEAALRKALELDPRYSHGYNNLGTLYQTQGRLDEAERNFRQALSLDGSLYEAHSNLLFCHAHDDRIAPELLFAEHARFGERFETPLKAHWPAHTNQRDPERPLRVGFVSADLRSHSVAYFVEPIFRYFTGSKGIQVHAYSNSDVEDRFTERLRGQVASFQRVTGDSDEQLAARIQSDRIDILVDLSGHTRKYRLLALARKPAPVQASWIGYPGTTGLTAMDYYLADRHFLPPGKFDDQFTEKIVCLPSVVPFLPAEESPEVAPLPAFENGYLTFGSFNRLSKITDSAVARWCELLRAFPESRMLLAGMPTEDAYRDLRVVFREHGVDAGRLTFHPRCGMEDYLALHAQVDLCLDTFGYTGGTTTLHALWMGVPTLTLAGPTPAGRQGASIMLHMGLAAYVAKDGADFVRRGKRIGRDMKSLARVRKELRGRMRASALGRPEKVAAGLEKALRIMWQRWCAGLPPQPFEVR